MTFDPQPFLQGPNLTVRPMVAADHLPLHAAASDPLTWEQHPSPDRYKRAVFDPYFAFLLSTGTCVTVVETALDRVVGCSRYYFAPGREDGVFIGFTFLDRKLWGTGANFELKTLMFEHVFKTNDEVWLDIGPDNIRSQKAALKVGAELAYEDQLDLGTGSKSHYLCFRVRKADWEQLKAKVTT